MMNQSETCATYVHVSLTAFIAVRRHLHLMDYTHSPAYWTIAIQSSASLESKLDLLGVRWQKPRSYI